MDYQNPHNPQTDYLKHTQRQFQIADQEERLVNPPGASQKHTTLSDIVLGPVYLVLTPLRWLWHDLTRQWFRLRIAAVATAAAGVMSIIGAVVSGVSFTGSAFTVGDWILRLSTDVLILGLLPRTYGLLAAFAAAIILVSPDITWWALEPYGLISALLKFT